VGWEERTKLERTYRLDEGVGIEVPFDGGERRYVEVGWEESTGLERTYGLDEGVGVEVPFDGEDVLDGSMEKWEHV